MTSTNISTKTDPDKKENWMPTSTRLRFSDRLLIKQACHVLEAQFGRPYTVSDFLRDTAIDRAAEILKQAA